MSAFTLDDLARIIADRAAASPETSYTAKLLAQGHAYCARKFGEEAIEAVVAGVEGDPSALTSEAADVIYHLLVLLRAGGVEVAAVTEELARRTARSGLAEKAARPKGR
ncbi:MAG: phosphoribosyl-ATP diphosphatase [Bauldia sp.]|nr:phosphoribosyl-ATP diphosphatase [Bauldia sp.]